MYDQREKELRDHEWMISGAREQGIEQGIALGIEQGIEQGILMGGIRLLLGFLGLPEKEGEFDEYSIEQLQAKLDELKRQFEAKNSA